MVHSNSLSDEMLDSIQMNEKSCLQGFHCNRLMNVWSSTFQQNVWRHIVQGCLCSSSDSKRDCFRKSEFSAGILGFLTSASTEIWNPHSAHSFTFIGELDVYLSKQLDIPSHDSAVDRAAWKPVLNSIAKTSRPSYDGWLRKGSFGQNWPRCPGHHMMDSWEKAVLGETG